VLVLGSRVEVSGFRSSLGLRVLQYRVEAARLRVV
jgi:hypothetical protein